MVWNPKVALIKLIIVSLDGIGHTTPKCSSPIRATAIGGRNTARRSAALNKKPHDIAGSVMPWPRVAMAVA